MCLLVLAWRTTFDHRLVLVGNRDEFHARPARAMHWWESPRLLAGRDLEAGGTWLGVDAEGRFAVVTNHRSPPYASTGRSRGELIPRFLAGATAPLAFLESLQAEAAAYAGFSLLAGDRDELAYFSNRDPAGPRTLAPGVYGLSNALLDTPWPKLTRTRGRLQALLAEAAPEPASLTAEPLLELLVDHERAADEELPDTGIGRERERWLSAPFIVGPDYGTRCTTALLLRADGTGEVVERSYERDGSAAALQRYALPEPGPGPGR
jgi:uncharacterized protein with NRDE domain